jgi:hypothetical protein
MRALAVVCLIGVLAFGAVGMAQDNTPDPCIDANASQNGTWRSEDKQCLLTEVISIDVRVSYPQELAERSPFAKSVIFNYINEERRNFWGLGEWAVRPDDASGDSSMSLNIRSELFHHSDTIVSVLFTSLWRGEQGQLTNLKTFTFDLGANKTLALEDLFVEGIDPYTTLSSLTLEALQKTLGDNLTDSIVRVTVPIPENYTHWALTEDSLLIFFSGYDIVGSGAAIGDTKIAEIPLADLGVSLKPEFLAAVVR